MNVIVVLLIGGIIGALGGVGIFFAPDEPYKIEIFLAAILKGMLVSLITALSYEVSDGQRPSREKEIRIVAVKILSQSCRTRLAVE